MSRRAGKLYLSIGLLAQAKTQTDSGYPGHTEVIPKLGSQAGAYGHTVRAPDPRRDNALADHPSAVSAMAPADPELRGSYDDLEQYPPVDHYSGPPSHSRTPSYAPTINSEDFARHVDALEVDSLHLRSPAPSVYSSVKRRPSVSSVGSSSFSSNWDPQRAADALSIDSRPPPSVKSPKGSSRGKHPPKTFDTRSAKGKARAEEYLSMVPSPLSRGVQMFSGISPPGSPLGQPVTGDHASDYRSPEFRTPSYVSAITPEGSCD